jgi:hypothetical protein
MSGFSAPGGRMVSCNDPENNRFPNESQNLCGDIFMARFTILVYSIQLVTIRKATLLLQAVNHHLSGPPPLNCLGAVTK